MEGVYQVFLIDDEPLSLEGLQFMVDWGKYEFEIHSVYDDGQEALNHIIEEKPDLVVTDIQMPIMDGISLIREIRESGNDWTHFVILSGYDDFDYAIQAMELGVTFYLTKPIKSSEADDVLMQIQKELDRRQHKKTLQNSVARYKVEYELSALLLDNDFKEHQQKKLLDSLSVTFNEVSKIVYYIVGTDADSYSLVKELVRRFVLEESCCYTIDLERQDFGIVHGLKNGCEHSDSEVFIAKLLESSVGRIDIAVGSMVEKIEQIPYSRVTAEEAKRFLFFGDKKVIYYDEIKEKLISADIEILKNTEIILKVMEGGNSEELKAVVYNTFHFFEERIIHPELVRIFFVQVLFGCTSLLKELGGEVDLLFDDFNLTGDALYGRRIQEAFEAFEQFVLKCQMLCVNLKKMQSGSTQEKVAAFLESNYTDEINIKNISERFHISPSYLGQSFLHRYGISILNYLHSLRINEAKRLLRDTKMTLTSISEDIGYHNYQYFLKQFERITGMKPAEYRVKSTL